MESTNQDARAKPDRRAAGFFLFSRQDDGLRYLLLWNAKRDEPGFPKGRADPGETPHATAYRETWEETGIGDVQPGPWFVRRMRYRVKGKLKEVIYFVGETTTRDVTLSPEHGRFAWLDFHEVCAALTHDSLRAQFSEAAAYLKDPLLRTGLSPNAARDLLIQHVGGDAPVVAHTQAVAAIARTLAGACEGIDVDYVEACAWVHDVGRARAHNERHPLEGHRMVTAAGHPGYAPSCLSHYLKGRAPQHVGLAANIARAMNKACDLQTFSFEEKLVALADSMAMGPRRVTLEARRDDLVRRYGSVAFFEHAHRAARDIRALFEQRSGRDLYRLIGV